MSPPKIRLPLILLLQLHRSLSPMKRSRRKKIRSDSRKKDISTMIVSTYMWIMNVPTAVVEMCVCVIISLRKLRVWLRELCIQREELNIATFITTYRTQFFVNPWLVNFLNARKPFTRVIQTAFLSLDHFVHFVHFLLFPHKDLSLSLSLWANHRMIETVRQQHAHTHTNVFSRTVSRVCVITSWCHFQTTRRRYTTKTFNMYTQCRVPPTCSACWCLSDDLLSGHPTFCGQILARQRMFFSSCLNRNILTFAGILVKCEFCFP